MSDTRTTAQIRAELYAARRAYLAMSTTDRDSQHGVKLLNTIKTNLRVLVERGEAT